MYFLTLKTEKKAIVREYEDELEKVVREGARRMLMLVLEEEVTEFLKRNRYERTEGEFKGYRNGYSKERSIAIGYGHVKVRQPRVSNVPKEISENGYESKILNRYQRSSRGVQANLCRLYIEGLSTGDFEPVFRALLGESAPLSASSIQRLKEDWEREYEEWNKRKLDKNYYCYIWVDGVYVRAGMEREKTVLLCVLGAKEDGTKELLAVGDGYRESKASWAEVLRDLKKRGMNCPLLTIGDGALGIWSALEEIYPESQQQRCWNHKITNILDKLPKRMEKEATRKLREIYQADTVEKCREWIKNYSEELRIDGHNSAADTLVKDINELTTFYNFPKIQWIHIKTNNPLESIFSGVKTRTKVVKRFRKRENAKYMIFKLIQRLSQNWKELKGKQFLPYLKQGVTFYNGIMVQDKGEKMAA